MKEFDDEDELFRYAEKQDFSDDILEQMDYRDHDSFRVYEKHFVSTAVDLAKVNGSSHPDYQGKTWLENLKGMKRGSMCLSSLFKNPNYYFDNKGKGSISYYECGDKCWIGEGSHRTFVGRYFLHLNGKSEIHGVRKTEIKEDLRKKALAERFRELDSKHDLAGINLEVINREESFRIINDNEKETFYSVELILKSSFRDFPIELTHDFLNRIERYIAIRPFKLKKFLYKDKLIKELIEWSFSRGWHKNAS